MANEDPAPGGIDGTRPNAARMEDYLLGGRNSFVADRQAADQLATLVPDLRILVRANRDFLGRAVRFLADAGVRQFIDIGAGLPTQGNVHEVAREVAPGARVVYVDNDPVVLVHARALLADTERVEVLEADLRDPEKIIHHPDMRAVIDFDEPVGLVLVAILHFVTDDDDPAGIVARFRDAIAPGSYVAISHRTRDIRGDIGARAWRPYKMLTAPIVPRSDTTVTGFFDGFELVRPGLVDVRAWDTEVREQPTDTTIYAGVGRKP